MRKGSNFSLPWLFQGSQALSSLTFMNIFLTFLPIYAINWQPFVVSKTWTLWWAPSASPKVSKTRVARQWVGTAYHGSFALTLGNLPLQPSHTQLLPEERKACEQQFILPWLPHSCLCIPAHRWGNPRQAPVSSLCSPAVSGGCVIISFRGSLTELSINQLNPNLLHSNNKAAHHAGDMETDCANQIVLFIFL